MLKILDQSSKKALGVQLNGKVLHKDYATFIPMLEKMIADNGGARCLVELVDFGGFELRTLWDELKFDLKHCADVERCAVVGDKSWEKWATNLSKPLFPSATMKFFPPEKIDEAWFWVKHDES
jgi:hypothetical protein